MSPPDNLKKKVLLVDEQDRPQGEMDKLEAHRKGVLHRAFSVLLFDRDGRLLLQQRATGKYHSGGLWTNTCCSHPAPDEPVKEAAYRRLHEEMGIHAPLRELFTTRYYLELGEGMIEHELDHVFFGISDEEPSVDGLEVMDQRFASRTEIDDELVQGPERFTEWFKVIWQKFGDHEKEEIRSGS
jgi:isopentenyl-diphosphate delta-isomerase